MRQDSVRLSFFDEPLWLPALFLGVDKRVEPHTFHHPLLIDRVPFPVERWLSLDTGFMQSCGEQAAFEYLVDWLGMRPLHGAWSLLAYEIAPKGLHA